MSEKPLPGIESRTGLDRPVIGLAGGIGSGKSTVARILSDLGCVVDDADESVRMLLDEAPVREQLVSWWGSGILGPEGRVDRRAVARIVFEDAAERTRLERLLHPLVHQRRIREWGKYPADAGVVAFVIDAPLLFEAELDRLCDAVIFVESDQSRRRERVCRERGWDAGELGRREKNQLALETKRDRSDHLIVNNGTIEDLRDQTQLTLKQILTAHGCRSTPSTDCGSADVKPQS